MEIATQLLQACRRLSGKGFFTCPDDSISMRLPGRGEMILAFGHGDWKEVRNSDLRAIPFVGQNGVAGLHASIYQRRSDVGAISISSPKGVRLLSRCSEQMPPLFDEQVRHIGRPIKFMKCAPDEAGHWVREVFARGTNAAIIREQLICLGMTCERAVHNTELFEKCAQAYVISQASGYRNTSIPIWVQFIANRRLLRDEGRAAKSYSEGRFPDKISGY